MVPSTPTYPKGRTHVEFSISSVDDYNEEKQTFTDYSKLEIIFHKPDGTIITKPARERNDGKEIYHLDTEGIFDQAGFWTYDGRVTYSNGRVWSSKPKSFYVV